METPRDDDDIVVPEHECDDLAPVFLEHPLSDPRRPTSWTDIGPDGARQRPRVEY